MYYILSINLILFQVPILNLVEKRVSTGFQIIAPYCKVNGVIYNLQKLVRLDAVQMHVRGSDLSARRQSGSVLRSGEENKRVILLF